jgi:hypothetical protein
MHFSLRIRWPDQITQSDALKVRILDGEKFHHADGWLHNRVNVFFDLARAKKSWLPLYCLEGYYRGPGL